MTAVAPPTTPSSPAAAPRRQGRTAVRSRAWIWFTLPFLVPFVLFYLLPIGYAIGQSLTKTERTGGIFGETTTTFAGLEQYSRVVTDPAFLNGVGRVLLFGVVQVPVMLGFALLLALLLDSAVARLKRTFRIVYFLPYGIPGVIAALMWAFLYSPQLSPIVGLLQDGGLDVEFLGSGTILWSIANVVTWTYTGYNMLIIFAAMQAIPQSVYEAAKVDGAGGLRTAWSIKIPLVLPALVLTGVFSIIGTLQLFTEPIVFRAISTNVTSSYTPNLLAYTTASANNYPLAAAMSVVLAVATFILSFAFLRATSRRSGL
ncbi:carbohydrate ABC transporter membrane protein 1, CUT1 family [Geodermatophilus saharensis]|uniref:Carbohydrate ABC transporter membrane protein 1, CUT1 family n=1 Tax=Geodermatophilus saharensis TaxID=1137994 RepID=A0A239G4X8_9ACTN|nr:sugar ABC transporter permease [Geodermatophilus saharensis]SNS64209.1 carbohydrate ABC transporter membrane protein 1, CUT1 family [Geodermatophilus saharensis]